MRMAPPLHNTSEDTTWKQQYVYSPGTGCRSEARSCLLAVSWLHVRLGTDLGLESRLLRYILRRSRFGGGDELRYGEVQTADELNRRATIFRTSM
jgi:hypothetical protein